MTRAGADPLQHCHSGQVQALTVGDSVRFDQLDITSTPRIIDDSHEVVCALHPLYENRSPRHSLELRSGLALPK